MFLSVAGPLPEVTYSFELKDGGSALFFPTHFNLTEGLSELYQCVIELATDDLEADIEKLLGAGVELEILRDKVPRYVTGVIRRIDFVGVTHGRLNVRAFVAPAAWVLKQRNDSRHWQKKSVVDILQEVLSTPLGDFKRKIRLSLTGKYKPREFCAQYRETDYDFACRLMAEEGIYFYFEFTGDGHEVMVLCDNNAALPDVMLADGESTVRLCPKDFDMLDNETVQSFDWQRALKSTSVVQRDFDWQAPYKPPMDEKRVPDARGRDREIYEPGERSYGGKDFGGPDAKAVSARKVESLVAKASVSIGSSNVLGFVPGSHFALDDHHVYDLATDHLVTRVSHSGTWESAQGGGDSKSTTYRNTFETIPYNVEFRAPRSKQRPLVQGPQTAIVTGPASEEIHVDKHGRVKVILAWDRLSPADDHSSCWVRVAQLTAGAGWGSMFIPRIGMEVVVEFLDGNPDRPLITGCVYNEANPTPYALPANKTRTTIKSNSTPGGNGSNELRFEDAAGKEEIYQHAQKDLTIKTENDKVQDTGNDEHLKVGNDRIINVVKDHKETVGGLINVTADGVITIKCGSSSITMTPGGVITVKASKLIQLTAKTVKGN